MSISVSFPDLEGDYEAAWAEWEESGDHAARESTAADGTSEQT